MTSIYVAVRQGRSQDLTLGARKIEAPKGWDWEGVSPSPTE